MIVISVMELSWRNPRSHAPQILFQSRKRGECDLEGSGVRGNSNSSARKTTPTTAPKRDRPVAAENAISWKLK